LDGQAFARLALETDGWSPSSAIFIVDFIPGISRPQGAKSPNKAQKRPPVAVFFGLYLQNENFCS
jgi:hypothetical protein